MNVWLITIGEPLPIDSENERLYRAGLIANLLHEKGHPVVWWTSSFNHIKKVIRVFKSLTVQVEDQYCIELLKGIKYKRNISISRIINHYQLARDFRKRAKELSPPDIILCSFPTIELSLEATRYGKKYDIPVLLDIRDLWPDLFLDFIPNYGKYFARIALSRLFRNARIACINATGMIALTDAFLNWGLSKANRNRSSFDHVFPMGYTSSIPDLKSLTEANDFWDKHNVKQSDFNVCFFGTLGLQFDIEMVIKAAQILKEFHPEIKFIICGTGDNFDFYKESAKGLSNVLFPSWVGKSEVWSLMRRSKVGLAPYILTENFLLNLPNKPLEYFSAGLPVISSIGGVLGEILTQNECGSIYQDAPQLAEVLIELNRAPFQLEKMGENAYQLFKREFVAEQVYDQLITFMEEVAIQFSNKEKE